MMNRIRIKLESLMAVPARALQKGATCDVTFDSGVAGNGTIIELDDDCLLMNFDSGPVRGMVGDDALVNLHSAVGPYARNELMGTLEFAVK